MHYWTVLILLFSLTYCVHTPHASVSASPIAWEKGGMLDVSIDDEDESSMAEDADMMQTLLHPSKRTQSTSLTSILPIAANESPSMDVATDIQVPQPPSERVETNSLGHRPSITISESELQGDIFDACQAGNLDAVRLFIEKNGANKEAIDRQYFTLLHRASQYGYMDIVRYLVAQGADKDAKARLQLTPLYLASWYGQVDVVRYLLEQGANKDVRDDASYFTPLHRAAMQGHVDVVALLIDEYNVDVDVKGSRDVTPLYLATQHGHLNVVTFLAAHGADIHAKAKSGSTPLSIARQQGHEHIVQYLQSQAARDGTQLTSQ